MGGVFDNRDVETQTHPCQGVALTWVNGNRHYVCAHYPVTLTQVIVYSMICHL